MTMVSSSELRLHVGQRLACSTGTTNVVVLDAGAAVHAPRCAGERMLPGGCIPCSRPDRSARQPADLYAGTIYADEQSGLRVLCTRSGSGPITVDDRELRAVSQPPRRLSVASLRSRS